MFFEHFEREMSFWFVLLQLKVLLKAIFWQFLFKIAFRRLKISSIFMNSFLITPNDQNPVHQKNIQIIRSARYPNTLKRKVQNPQIKYHKSVHVKKVNLKQEFNWMKTIFHHQKSFNFLIKLHSLNKISKIKKDFSFTLRS